MSDGPAARHTPEPPPDPARSTDPPAVGVLRLRSPAEFANVPAYAGVSYCHAVGEAGQGRPLRVLAGSIEVCRWSPTVLGLQEPLGGFERGLAPRLNYPTAGLLLARLEQCPCEPEVVLVRATPERLRSMVERAGFERLWAGPAGRLDLSATPLLTRKPARVTAHRRALIQGVNQALELLAHSARWRGLTFWLFRRRWATVTFDALISRALADMSVCRNSTAIPLLTGCANISFFCTGGITWGLNPADRLTSGWPWAVYQEAR